MIEKKDREAPLEWASGQLSWKPKFAQSATDKRKASRFFALTDAAGITSNTWQVFRFASEHMLFCLAALEFPESPSVPEMSISTRCSERNQGRIESVEAPRSQAANVPSASTPWLEVLTYRVWLASPDQRRKMIRSLRWGKCDAVAYIVSRAPQIFQNRFKVEIAGFLMRSIDWDTEEETIEFRIDSAILIGPISAQPALNVLGRRDENPRARMAAIRVISQFGSAAHVDLLEQLLEQPELCSQQEIEALEREQENLRSALLSSKQVDRRKKSHTVKSAALFGLSVLAGYASARAQPGFRESSALSQVKAVHGERVPLRGGQDSTLARDEKNRERLSQIPELLTIAKERTAFYEPLLRSRIQSLLDHLASRSDSQSSPDHRA